MNLNSTPPLKDLVLVGGGHSHVAVLKAFGMKPLDGIRITVIARDIQTPYSGMLPGYIAGHYTFDESHVDLGPLSSFTGARLFHDEAIGLDLLNKKIICKVRPPVGFDVLSINIGSKPSIRNVPGALKFTTPVKPINGFVDRWEALLARILNQKGPHHIGVVGAGAGGVEVLLSAQFRLEKIFRDQGRSRGELFFYLISRSHRILPSYPVSVSKRFEKILLERQVKIFCNISANKISKKKICLSNNVELALDEVLWATGASAPHWIKESGLDVSEDGFLRVSECLQSTSHPSVYGAGDIANVDNQVRPKSGVFAVRQGGPLSKNLRRALLGIQPQKFTPQKSALALISTGNQYAIAVKSQFVSEGKLHWILKDWIDKRWVRKYSDLPRMKLLSGAKIDSRLANKNTVKEISAIAMRCGGCGAKVGSSILSQALANIKPVERNDVLIGLHEPDDAAVVKIGEDILSVHTVDYFRSFFDDPFIFGQIAANHSLSDLFAMGAEARSALAIVTVPFGLESKTEETINHLMLGATKVLNDANAALVGGHTSEGNDLALGFSVNGVISKDRILRKGGMKSGDNLILTKALGTGTIFAAQMQRRTKGLWITNAIESMLQSNRVAADIFFSYGANACTDITGFGLLGHMIEMIKASKVDVEISLNSIPVLTGAEDTLRMGIVSSLQAANIRLRRAIKNFEEIKSELLFPILFDPQTSGGLLASVPQTKVDNCLKKLNEAGYSKSCVIGAVVPEGDAAESISIFS